MPVVSGWLSKWKWSTKASQKLQCLLPLVGGPRPPMAFLPLNTGHCLPPRAGQMHLRPTLSSASLLLCDSVLLCSLTSSIKLISPVPKHVKEKAVVLISLSWGRGEADVLSHIWVLRSRGRKRNVCTLRRCKDAMVKSGAEDRCLLHWCRTHMWPFSSLYTFSVLRSLT